MIFHTDRHLRLLVQVLTMKFHSLWRTLYIILEATLSFHQICYLYRDEGGFGKQNQQSMPNYRQYCEVHFVVKLLFRHPTTTTASL